MRDWFTFEPLRRGHRRARWGMAPAPAATFAVVLAPTGSGAPAAAPDRILGWRATLGPAK